MGNYLIGSRPDGFFLEHPHDKVLDAGYQDDKYNYTGRTQANTRAVVADNPLILLTSGQSNFSHRVNGTYVPTNPVYNLSIGNGAIYEALDPLLGCDLDPVSGLTTPGNITSELADILIDDGYFTSAVVVPIAIGGTAVAHWAPGGMVHYRWGVAARRIAAVGLNLADVIICWLQGESDHEVVFDTPRDVYTARLNSAIATCRSVGLTGPFFVAQCSYLGGSSPQTDNDVRNGQLDAVNNGAGVYFGGDMDVFTYPTYRYDGAHFNTEGRAAVASTFATNIEAYLDSL